MGFDDWLIEKIKKGEIYIAVCEPLKDFDQNLAFCPNRDECELWRDEYIGEYEDLIETMFCDFCESEDWIIFGVTKNGSMITILVSEEYGKKILEVLKSLRSSRHPSVREEIGRRERA